MARQLVDAPPAQERRLTMTYKQFLAWSGEDTHAEWVDGEVIVFVPPNLIHQRLSSFLEALLSWFVRRHDLGEVVRAPFEMLIRPGHSAREPDLLFVSRANAARLTLERLEGAADLVVEIVSAHSAVRDEREKFAEYEAAGVPEYWLLDPRSGERRARFFRLGSDGRYRAIAPGGDGRYYSAVLPGFWLDPAWLWQDPLPDPDDLKPLILTATVRP